MKIKEVRNIQCQEQFLCKEVHQSQSDLSQGKTDETLIEPVSSQPKSLVCIVQTSLWDSKRKCLADSKKQKKTIHYVEPLRTPEGDLDLERLVLEILAPKPQSYL